MQKIFILYILSVTIYASYNPFFQETTKPKVQKQIFETNTKKVYIKPKPKRKNINITYFGFIESKKGKFALVNFQNKNIVIRRNDSLYIDEQIFKIKKITSNYILIKDRYSRLQTVYFSSLTKQSI
ncbi:MAG: hypothetical protein U9N02_02245 [Campylobacterota bacterium]|nr:hypothetical protein [Campylobacterota bacterium]